MRIYYAFEEVPPGLYEEADRGARVYLCRRDCPISGQEEPGAATFAWIWKSGMALFSLALSAGTMNGPMKREN